jgi:hypothetical protein
VFILPVAVVVAIRLQQPDTAEVVLGKLEAHLDLSDLQIPVVVEVEVKIGLVEMVVQGVSLFLFPLHNIQDQRQDPRP